MHKRESLPIRDTYGVLETSNMGRGYSPKYPKSEKNALSVKEYERDDSPNSDIGYGNRTNTVYMTILETGMAILSYVYY